MNTATIQPGWFSIEGAALYTGFSETSIRNAMDAGKFPVRRVKITGKGTKDAVRIRRRHLDAWIEGKPVKAPAS